MKVVHIIAFILLIVGGLNWAVFALFDTDLGEWIGGADTMAAKVVYVLVGVAAVVEAVTHSRRCKECKADSVQGAPMGSM